MSPIRGGENYKMHIEIKMFSYQQYLQLCAAFWSKNQLY